MENPCPSGCQNKHSEATSLLRYWINLSGSRMRPLRRITPVECVSANSSRTCGDESSRSSCLIRSSDTAATVDILPDVTRSPTDHLIFLWYVAANVLRINREVQRQSSVTRLVSAIRNYKQFHVALRNPWLDSYLVPPQHPYRCRFQSALAWWLDQF